MEVALRHLLTPILTEGSGARSHGKVQKVVLRERYRSQ